jgi:hypothetical protein
MPRGTIKLLCLLAVFGLCAALCAQGLNTTATKDDWEEINFEFNSSILSDGYPSLLVLAEMLVKHADYRVQVEGHTDIVGSDEYNDKLALARAETVKSFLALRGVRASQITTSGRGRRNPSVENTTPEGRFMNRRVTITVSDGQGNIVSAGGIGEAVKAMTAADDCCKDVLSKLGKLDENAAALRDLSAKNDQLRQELAALQKQADTLRQGQAGVQQQVAQIPKPLGQDDMSRIMDEAARKVIEELRPKRFEVLDLNAGPDDSGNISFSGKARFFTPFGDNHALQAQGEYLRYQNRQEGQLDIGLLDRRGPFQAGLFSSFRRVQLKEYAGGTLGQAALTLDIVFSRGRVGAFGTKSFLDEPVIRRLALRRNIFEETYLRVVDQVGGSAQIGLFGNTYLEGNFGMLFSRGGDNRPGGTIRFVQPLAAHVAFTAEAGLNETLLGSSDTGRLVVGLQFGNWITPKEYAGRKEPVPVDVPRVRYEMLTRVVREGNDPPVADAGPNQIDVASGLITLDGSASYDPDDDPITYQWSQVSGPSVTIADATKAVASFTAADAQTYVFRLVVTDSKGATGQARVTISTKAAPQVKIIRFSAEPPQIDAGRTTTLVWEVRDADEVSISGIGHVDPVAGTSTLTLTETTTFTLTAKNRVSEATEKIKVTVNRPQVRIIKFQATPSTITSGGSSTLSWETENATEVTLSSAGSVSLNGVTTVSPSATTTYTLTARNQYGQVTATTTVTVTVTEAAPANHPPVADAGLNQTVTTGNFSLNGSASYDPDGDEITFSWRVSGAKPAQITGATTATPSVVALQGWGDYIFELTVTDSKGARSIATTTVNFIDP